MSVRQMAENNCSVAFGWEERKTELKNQFKGKHKVDEFPQT